MAVQQEPEASPPSTGKKDEVISSLGLGSLIAFLANRSSTAWVRECFTFAAPTLGALITLGWRAASKRIYHWRGNEDLKAWIKEGVAELPHATPERQEEIKIELIEYRARLRQRRLDNLP
jgi:hypothetical protein